jgi:hypothetical protein
MNNFFLRLALIGGLFSLTGACTAGNYDLPVCMEIEQCGNGIDDDCDGIKDNFEICNCTAMNDRRPCPARAGIVTQKMNPASICTDEEQVCLPNMQWSSCKGVDPIIEKCGNKLDDDCDGTVDQQDPGGCVNCVNGETQTLTNPTLTYGPNSICKAEIQDCQQGAWVTRPGAEPIGPRPTDSTCDGFDDDCDGSIDEDARWNSFPLGATCSDPSKKGICRTTGTVVCNNGTAICQRTMFTPDSNYRNAPAFNVYSDSSTLNAAWDWNCDGNIESIFCTGMSSVCNDTSSSRVNKTIYISLDPNADCSVVKYLSGLTICNSVIIKPKTDGEFVQCGTKVSITECRPPILPLAPNCENRVTQDGFLYCR